MLSCYVCELELSTHAHTEDSDVADVVANEMLFDETGVLVGFGPELLHTFNKRFSSVPNAIAHVPHVVSRRRCLIVLGDSIGDVNMSDGYECDVVLKIGFLNRNPENLAAYMVRVAACTCILSQHSLPHLHSRHQNAFDVVIAGDSSMQYVVDILSRLA